MPDAEVGVPGNDVGSPVSRTVIYDDHLPVRISLRKDALDAGADEALMVEGGSQD